MISFTYLNTKKSIGVISGNGATIMELESPFQSIYQRILSLVFLLCYNKMLYQKSESDVYRKTYTIQCPVSKDEYAIRKKTINTGVYKLFVFGYRS